MDAINSCAFTIFIKWLTKIFLSLRKVGDRGRDSSPISIWQKLFFFNARHARSLDEAHWVTAWSLWAWLVWAGRCEDGWWGKSQDGSIPEAMGASARLPQSSAYSAYFLTPSHHFLALILRGHHVPRKAPYRSATQITPNSVIRELIVKPLR